ncbi:MAG: hypothetical protein ACR2PG_00605 [Hyphomicrobiaceae bacterium]
MTKPRKMPPPWTVVEIPVGYRIDDAEGTSVAYCYGLAPRELPAAGHLRLTRDEARRVACYIAKLPDLLRREEKPTLNEEDPCAGQGPLNNGSEEPASG